VTWEYITAEYDDNFLNLRSFQGGDHKQSLQGGLTYLGSQGWELAADLDYTKLGTTARHVLIFKRPKG